MVYHKHSINLSRVQMKNLAEARTVRLKHANLTGSHPVYLTQTQYKRFHKAHQAGTGVDLKMSAAQLAHHRKVGGSVLDDFLTKIKDGAKYAYEKIIKPSAATILEDYVVPKAKGKLEDVAKSLLGKAGLGVKSRKRRVKGGTVEHDIHGDGFFDDVWSGIKNVGSFAADKILPVAAPLLLKAALGGGVKRGRKKKVEGASISLPSQRP